MSERNGSRNQSPPRREDISLHWARVSKLQDTTAEVTSLRQYSPADAGVAIATKASALSAVMGAGPRPSTPASLQCCGRQGAQQSLRSWLSRIGSSIRCPAFSPGSSAGNSVSTLLQSKQTTGES